eukprot:SM000327S12489  [mRNA]  locus=s327:47440:56153:- [translate_table: standard]
MAFLLRAITGARKKQEFQTPEELAQRWEEQRDGIAHALSDKSADVCPRIADVFYKSGPEARSFLLSPSQELAAAHGDDVLALVSELANAGVPGSDLFEVNAKKFGVSKALGPTVAWFQQLQPLLVEALEAAPSVESSATLGPMAPAAEDSQGPEPGVDQHVGEAMTPEEFTALLAATGYASVDEVPLSALDTVPIAKTISTTATAGSMSGDSAASGIYSEPAEEAYADTSLAPNMPSKFAPVPDLQDNSQPVFLSGSEAVDTSYTGTQADEAAKSAAVALFAPDVDAPSAASLQTFDQRESPASISSIESTTMLIQRENDLLAVESTTISIQRENDPLAVDLPTLSTGSDLKPGTSAPSGLGGANGDLRPAVAAVVAEELQAGQQPGVLSLLEAGTASQGASSYGSAQSPVTSTEQSSLARTSRALDNPYAQGDLTGRAVAGVPGGIPAATHTDFLPDEGELRSLAAISGLDKEVLQKGLTSAKAAADKLGITAASAGGPTLVAPMQAPASGTWRTGSIGPNVAIDVTASGDFASQLPDAAGTKSLTAGTDPRLEATNMVTPFIVREGGTQGVVNADGAVPPSGGMLPQGTGPSFAVMTPAHLEPPAPPSPFDASRASVQSSTMAAPESQIQAPAVNFDQDPEESLPVTYVPGPSVASTNAGLFTSTPRSYSEVEGKNDESAVTAPIYRGPGQESAQLGTAAGAVAGGLVGRFQDGGEQQQILEPYQDKAATFSEALPTPGSSLSMVGKPASQPEVVDHVPQSDFMDSGSTMAMRASEDSAVPASLLAPTNLTQNIDQEMATPEDEAAYKLGGLEPAPSGDVAAAEAVSASSAQLAAAARAAASAAQSHENGFRYPESGAPAVNDAASEQRDREAAVALGAPLLMAASTAQQPGTRLPEQLGQRERPLEEPAQPAIFASRFTPIGGPLTGSSVPPDYMVANEQSGVVGALGAPSLMDASPAQPAGAQPLLQREENMQPQREVAQPFPAEEHGVPRMEGIAREQMVMEEGLHTPPVLNAAPAQQPETLPSTQFEGRAQPLVESLQPAPLASGLAPTGASAGLLGAEPSLLSKEGMAPAAAGPISQAAPTAPQGAADFTIPPSEAAKPEGHEINSLAAGVLPLAGVAAPLETDGSRGLPGSHRVVPHRAAPPPPTTAMKPPSFSQPVNVGDLNGTGNGSAATYSSERLPDGEIIAAAALNMEPNTAPAAIGSMQRQFIAADTTILVRDSVQGEFPHRKLPFLSQKSHKVLKDKVHMALAFGTLYAVNYILGIRHQAPSLMYNVSLHHTESSKKSCWTWAASSVAAAALNMESDLSGVPEPKMAPAAIGSTQGEVIAAAAALNMGPNFSGVAEPKTAPAAIGSMQGEVIAAVPPSDTTVLVRDSVQGEVIAAVPPSQTTVLVTKEPQGAQTQARAGTAAILPGAINVYSAVICPIIKLQPWHLQQVCKEVRVCKEKLLQQFLHRKRLFLVQKSHKELKDKVHVALAFWTLICSYVLF